MALPVSDVQSTSTFLEWRTSTNQVKNNVLDKTLNFSDVPDPATARTNLGIQDAIDSTAISLIIALS